MNRITTYGDILKLVAIPAMFCLMTCSSHSENFGSSVTSLTYSGHFASLKNEHLSNTCDYLQPAEFTSQEHDCSNLNNSSDYFIANEDEFAARVKVCLPKACEGDSDAQLYLARLYHYKSISIDRHISDAKAALLWAETASFFGDARADLFLIEQNSRHQQESLDEVLFHQNKILSTLEEESCEYKARFEKASNLQGLKNLVIIAQGNEQLLGWLNNTVLQTIKHWRDEISSFNDPDFYNENINNSIRWFNSSKSANNLSTRRHLSHLTLRGIGVPKDTKSATSELTKLAEEESYIPAINDLISIYSTGEWVDINPENVIYFEGLSRSASLENEINNLEYSETQGLHAMTNKPMLTLIIRLQE